MLALIAAETSSCGASFPRSAWGTRVLDAMRPLDGQSLGPGATTLSVGEAFPRRAWERYASPFMSSSQH
jgi:hypothetical protein